MMLMFIGRSHSPGSMTERADDYLHPIVIRSASMP